MPRVYRVKKARRAHGTCGKCGAPLEAGQPYVWWKFKRAGRRNRCAKPACAPRRQDLTLSEISSVIYDLEDAVPVFAGDESQEDRDSGLSEFVDQIESDLVEMLQEKIDAVQEAFPNGSHVIDDLEERRGEAEAWRDAVQSAEGLEWEDQESAVQDHGCY